MPVASEPFYNLQVVETRLDSEQAALHDVEIKLGSSPEIDVAKTRVDRLSTEGETIRASLRKLEVQAEDAATKAKRFTATLYGGRIHDSREMASVEAEIAHAKSLQSRFEDEEINLLERLDTIESDVANASSKLDELIADRSIGLESLTRERDRLAGSVENLEAERDVARSRLDPARLAMYGRLRERTGHAVSLIEDGVCQWCRVQVPTKDIQHARGDVIVTCNNCGRVLYPD